MSVIDLTCLLETPLEPPDDDTLEVDQFRCVTCCRVTWEHDHDGDGECPDCAETTRAWDRELADLVGVPALVAGTPRAGKGYAARWAALDVLTGNPTVTAVAGVGWGVVAWT